MRSLRNDFAAAIWALVYSSDDVIKFGPVQHQTSFRTLSGRISIVATASSIRSSSEANPHKYPLVPKQERLS